MRITISSFTPIFQNVYLRIGVLFGVGIFLSGQPALADRIERTAPLQVGQQTEETENPTARAQEYNEQGIELVRSGQYAEAVAVFQSALEIYPDSEKLYLNLGIALGYDRQFTEAVVAFESALEINPENGETYNNLGIALGNQELYDEAIAAFDRAIAIDPDSPIPYHNSAVAYMKQEKFDEAIVSLEAARERYLNQDEGEVVELIDSVLLELRDRPSPSPSEPSEEDSEAPDPDSDPELE
ncbi:tetratricopeptide repeat protein [Roseofilum casamattae]|uniref:Tetratricopeptide repeat protein n=1 Tax=Roseofilum casamattae BLCC-M143 TaxID=3022442 RepID=A0ABT7BXZ2_9CYAN|nr:tetratricopeptide repeat protein [Roseofilum casamattae]MDJ1183682.1 tetratricopeptide repeat protein [Roseofilum casamattae BLCC-M143]